MALARNTWLLAAFPFLYFSAQHLLRSIFPVRWINKCSSIRCAYMRPAPKQTGAVQKAQQMTAKASRQVLNKFLTLTTPLINVWRISCQNLIRATSVLQKRTNQSRALTDKPKSVTRRLDEECIPLVERLQNASAGYRQAARHSPERGISRSQCETPDLVAAINPWLFDRAKMVSPMVGNVTLCLSGFLQRLHSKTTFCWTIFAVREALLNFLFCALPLSAY